MTSSIASDGVEIHADIRNGTRVAPDEAIVWRGTPSWRRVARDILHARGISTYLAFLVALDFYQAWDKEIPLARAVHDSVPLFVIIAIVLGNVIGIAWLMGRTTRYTITDRRVILEYGIAIPATLSLPYARLQTVSVAMNADHTGDIPLVLKPGEHMPYLKLWPHARPWRLTHPEPMLRCVPQAAAVAGLLTRAATSAAQAAAKPKRQPEVSVAA